MNPSCNHYHQDSAHSRRHHDWQPLSFDDVEIEHQRYRSRNKEEPEILYQKICHSLHLTKFDGLNL